LAAKVKKPALVATVVVVAVARKRKKQTNRGMFVHMK